MIYQDDKFRIEIFSILAIYDYTIYLDSVSIDVKDPMGLTKYWSAIDPACVLLVRKDTTLVLDAQSIIFVSGEQVILQGTGEAIQFNLHPGEYAKITESQTFVDELLDNDTYHAEVLNRAEEYQRRHTLALPPAPKDEVVEAHRAFLSNKYSHLFVEGAPED